MRKVRGKVSQNKILVPIKDQAFEMSLTQDGRWVGVNRKEAEGWEHLVNLAKRKVFWDGLDLRRCTVFLDCHWNLLMFSTNMIERPQKHNWSH